MKGQSHNLSSYLPNDLISFLSFSQDDLENLISPFSVVQKPNILPIISSNESQGFDTLKLSKFSTQTPSSFNSNCSLTATILNNSPHPQLNSTLSIAMDLGLEEKKFPSFKDFLSEKTNRQNFLYYIKSNAGSHLFQRMSKGIDSSDIDHILSLISPEMKQVMCNSYGNYFLQKIILKANKSQRLLILNLIEKDFVKIASDICGNHCLQVLIELMSSKEEENIIKRCVKGNLYNLVTTQNSTHVILKLLAYFNQSKNNYLSMFLIKNLFPLSLNLYGSMIIRKFISQIENIQHMQIVLSILNKYYIELIENQFGNFVIQEAFDKFSYSQCCSLISTIVNHAIYFSVQKYSSNVIDKIAVILRKNSSLEFSRLITICLLDLNGLYSLSQTKYGLFVCCNIIKLLSKEEKQNIKNILINKGNIFKGNCSKLSQIICLLE